MGGDYLIELAWRAVAYLGRSLLRRRKLRRAAGWLPVRGRVISVIQKDGTVEVSVTYQVDGGYYCDHHKRDLFWTEAAKEYASRLPAETNCVIRVNPTHPEETAFFDDDQITPMSVATAAAPDT